MSRNFPSIRRLCVLGLVAVALVASVPVPARGAELSKLQKELDSVAAEYGRLETELAKTDARRRKLEADLRVADKTIADKGQLMQVRAGAMYKKGGMSSYLSDLILAPSPNAFFRRLRFMEVLGRGDTELIEGLRVTQARAGEMRASLAETRAMQARLVEQQRDKKVQLEAKLQGVKSAAKVSRIRTFSAFTLPIGGAQAFADTWGAPRSGGRRHKGTDVMAACGAPVVAVTDGVIGNLANRGNAGIMAYLRAPNGDVFFYAHLKGYAPGIGNGTRVTVGQKIGINGNSGNARGGPCHVHLEWRKGGGGPVNPYPLLNAARS